MKILIYPNPVLRKEAESVQAIDDDLRKLADEMIDLMYTDDGIGLAAPQVGISKQLIVLDIGEGPIVLFNPKIIELSDEHEPMEEGCLSFPDIRISISRPKRIKVTGMNQEGDTVQFEAEGLPAKVFQHEIDHLNGVLIIDYASSIQRTLIRSKLKKLEKVN